MFNRTVEIKITKPAREVNKSAPDYDLRKADEVIRALARDAAKLVAGYIVLDACRKAVIAKAAHGCCRCL
jgi:hypothetical protein